MRKKDFIRKFYIYIKETSENFCFYFMKETSEIAWFYFMIGFLSSLYPDTIFLWCGKKYTPNNKYLLELIKRRSTVQEKNVIWTWFKFWPIKNIFRISQWEFDYGWFTSLLIIIVTCDFSQSSFKLRRGILPLLTKYVS